MLRGEVTGYDERVDVIGTPQFMELVEQLEKDENLKLEEFTVGTDKLAIVTVQPDPAKAGRDVELARLSPVLVREQSPSDEIAALDARAFRCPPFPMTAGSAEERAFRYEGKDLVTLQRIVERDDEIPQPQTAQEVIGYCARRIAQDVKLPSQFAALAPKVRRTRSSSPRASTSSGCSCTSGHAEVR